MTSERDEQRDVETVQRPRRAHDEAYAPPDPAQRVQSGGGQVAHGDPGLPANRPAAAPRRPGRVNSDLDLNQGVPSRAQPAIGDWGPTGLPTTREKRRQRWLTPVAFAVALVVMVVAWRYFAQMLG